MYASILKLALVASMGLVASAASLPKGLTPMSPEGEFSAKGCYPDSYNGECTDSGYCWAACDAKGNWAWLIYKSNNKYAGCGSNKDCSDGLSNGSMLRWNCGGC